MQIFQEQFRSILWQIVDTVLPPRCIVTGDFVDRQGMVAPAAWLSLDFITDPFCNVCGFPFDFQVDENMLCTSCLESRPQYETARAALKYNDASRNMILGFKHADKLHFVESFVPWLKRCGDKMLAEADYIIPVPLHRWRLLSRRYNQSALIANALANETGHDYIADALVRVRATPPQGHMSAKDRFKNVRRAFIVNQRWTPEIKGKNVVLIDDVYTTGATVKECTKALLQAGVAKVNVLTLSRVVYHD